MDRRGDTVYELGGESLSNLQCVSLSCLKTFQPVLVRSATTKVPVASGLPGKLTILRRPKANLYQVMLNNHPLYFYSGDSTIGATQGQGRTALRMKSIACCAAAPGVNASATPSCLNSSTSSAGIVPPTVTTTSPTHCSRSSCMIGGTRLMYAPDTIETPTASPSSWITVSTICSGVCEGPCR